MLAVYCELVCRQCATTGDTGRFSFKYHIPRRELKKRAEEQGWVFASEEPFCSQTCLTQFERDTRMKYILQRKGG